MLVREVSIEHIKQKIKNEISFNCLNFYFKISANNYLLIDFT